MRVLLAETPGFERANYRALFEHLDGTPIDYLAVRIDRSGPLANGGAERAAALRRDLDGLSPRALATAEHRGQVLSGLIGCDLLARLLQRPSWAGGAGPNDVAAVIERACRSPEDREAVVGCLSAAGAWVDHWAGLLARQGPFTHAIVERGTSIAARSLQEVAAREGLRIFTVAPFLGAGPFFLEAGCGPLPGRSRLGEPAAYEGLQPPVDPDTRDRARAEAHRRWAGLLRYDAAAGSSQLEPRPFPTDGGKTVLVVGQALDDPAILGVPAEEVSILAQYRKLMADLLETSAHRIIFVMGNGGRAVSGGADEDAVLAGLSAWRATLPPDRQVRVLLRRDGFRPELLRHADQVVGHSAPELLAACGAGLKPAVIAPAFFGGKGFTEDHGSWETLVSALASDHVDPYLSLEAYETFESFLVRALLIHLVPGGAEGRERVTELLSDHDGHTRPARAGFRFEAQSELAEVPFASLVRDVARNPVPWALMRFGRRR